MAKKAAKSDGEGDTNKSQAIRDYIQEHPEEGPTAVASALNEKQGWEISPAYVSTIKNKMKQPSGGSSGGSSGSSSGGAAGRPAATRGRPAGRGGSGGSIEQSLIQAKQLAKQAGGINQAKAALDLLAKLTD